MKKRFFQFFAYVLIFSQLHVPIWAATAMLEAGLVHQTGYQRAARDQFDPNQEYAETAAGVLHYATDPEGNHVVLLAQRNVGAGIGTWGNLGGALR